jgi:hypothetical protein
MGTRFRRGGLASLAVAALLLGQPGKVEAHPHLACKWVTPAPAGGYMSYDFRLGKYIGMGVWEGPFFLVVSNVPVSTGIYELRMFTGNEGTISLRDGTCIGVRVGIVDFRARAMTFMNEVYRPAPYPAH